jgi:uncharacterized protein (DUF362 family)
MLPVTAAVAACQRPPYRASDFTLPRVSGVSLFDASDYAADFSDVVRRALQQLHVSVAGVRVLLKPNLVEYIPGAPINTDPLVVAGAAEAFLRAGAREVIVAEGPGHRRDVDYLVSATGLRDYLRDLRVRFVDLNHDDVRIVSLGSNFTGLGSLALPATLLDADLVVSMPKLKSHHWAGMTASMKNFFGVVPGAIYGWPKNILHFKGIEPSIVDLVATVKPGLSIVDAVDSMEGDGPIMGQRRRTGFVAIGRDVVAVDATCARIMGLDPKKLAYLETAGRFLGNIDVARIEQLGEPVERYRTEFALLDHLTRYRMDGS